MNVCQVRGEYGMSISWYEDEGLCYDNTATITITEVYWIEGDE